MFVCFTSHKYDPEDMHKKKLSATSNALNYFTGRKDPLQPIFPILPRPLPGRYGTEP